MPELRRGMLAHALPGLRFLSATVTGSKIGRVRITSGRNMFVANGQSGNLIDAVVLMDDFIYAESLRAIPKPSAPGLPGLALFCGLTVTRRRRYLL